MYLEELLIQMQKSLERIETRLDQLEVKGIMTVSDIADYTKVNKSLLYTTKRYLLPDFGRNAKEGQRMEWTKQEVMDWLKRGTDVLKREYELAKIDEEKRA